MFGRTSPADVAIAAGVGPALDAIAAALPEPSADHLAWRAKASAKCRAFADEGPEAHGAVDMAEVVRTVAAKLRERDHIITNDGGNFATWVHRHFPYTRPWSQVGPMAGAMGAAVPSAVAAKIARPGAEVVAFVGDGGFLMTGQELATAVKERLAVRIIVCDNGAYGTILMHQHRFAGPGRYHGVRLRSPDFAAIGRVYGAAAWTVERTADFAPAFDAALADDGPALLHLKTDIRDISASGPLEP